MAVKASRRKVQYKRWFNKNAMKIMCKYCQRYNDCPNQATKEASEQAGVMTRCTLTPNKKIKQAAWEKVNKKGETINLNRNGIPVNKFFNEERVNNRTDDQRRRPVKKYNDIRRESNESKPTQ